MSIGHGGFEHQQGHLLTVNLDVLLSLFKSVSSSHKWELKLYSPYLLFVKIKWDGNNVFIGKGGKSTVFRSTTHFTLLQPSTCPTNSELLVVRAWNSTTSTQHINAVAPGKHNKGLQSHLPAVGDNLPYTPGPQVLQFSQALQTSRSFSTEIHRI